MRPSLAAEQPRILVTTDAVGGVWTHSLDLARGLGARGVAVTLAVLGPPPNEAQIAEAVECRVLATGLPLDWSAPDAETVLQAGHALAGLAAEEGADLVHLNSPALAGGGRFAMPLLVGCHSCVATWWEAVRGTRLPPEFMRQRELVAAGYRNADLLVAPTKAFAAETARCYGLRQAPHVVHNGRRVASTALPIGREGILAAGRLWDEAKNMALLSRIAPHLGVPIDVAGPLDAPHGGRAELPGLRHLGVLGAGEMARRFASTAIFVSPARYEPFGLAVLEAAQAGCALVLTDIPSFREVWGEAADYAAWDDDAGFLRALQRLMGDAALREQRGMAARRRAACYSVDAMVEGMLGLYRSLLPNRLATGVAA